MMVPGRLPLNPNTTERCSGRRYGTNRLDLLAFKALNPEAMEASLGKDTSDLGLSDFLLKAEGSPRKPGYLCRRQRFTLRPTPIRTN
jgi:hypothetical protein